MMFKNVLALGAALTSVTTAAPFPPQKWTFSCTTGSCSADDMARFSAYVNAIKTHPHGNVYDVYSEITQVKDGASGGDELPKEMEDGIVSIQRRGVAAPTPAPVAVPNDQDGNGNSNVNIDEATKGAMVDQAEKLLVHCSSAEGGCSPDQVDQIENSIHAAGWGFLKPIFDLIGRFKFNYGLEIGDKADQKPANAVVSAAADPADGEYTTPVMPDVPDVPEEKQPMVSTY
ncbi:hypothetical protein KEM56_007875 [Ascosphaera pollenicola]|nr:hypothetical protein KEM56_007875 [Ascosphaera pollenicola]